MELNPEWSIQEYFRSVHARAIVPSTALCSRTRLRRMIPFCFQIPKKWVVRLHVLVSLHTEVALPHIQDASLT